MMVRTASIAMVLGLSLPLLARAADKPAGIPANYKLLYEQTFAGPDAMKAFAFPDPKAWRLAEVDGTTVLEQFRPAKYKPPHRSPGNFGLIAGKKFGEFVMDIECQQTGKEYGHRDMVFVFGYQNPSQYYYSHIATKADDHANNIFIVDNAPRTKISTTTNPGNDWGKDAWKTVRVVRKPDSGTIRIYFDDMKTPIMEATNDKFGTGWVGFGTFDDTARVRSVKIWGKTAEDTDAPKFAGQK